MSRHSTLGAEKPLPADPGDGAVGQRDDGPDRGRRPGRLQRLCHQTYQTQRTWENDDGASGSQPTSTFAPRPPSRGQRRISGRVKARLSSNDIVLLPTITNTFSTHSSTCLQLKWVTGSGFSCSCHGAIHLFANGVGCLGSDCEKAIYGKEPALWIILYLTSLVD